MSHTCNSLTCSNGQSSQFYDLIEIFRIGGYAPNTNYLFLGMSFIETLCCQISDRMGRRLR